MVIHEGSSTPITRNLIIGFIIGDSRGDAIDVLKE